jgi:maleylacetoacetate isomerase
MALEPFQCSPLECEDQIDPTPLEYLQDPSYATSSYDIQLSVSIQGERMEKPATVCRSNYRYLYWNSRQQMVHHAVTGCIIHPGDLMGSGTISGTDSTSLGCMLELSWMGSREVKLGDDGEVRKFLKDGDTVIMEGFCVKENHGRVGFGQCTGKVLPASISPIDDEKVVDLEPQQEQQKEQQRFINLKLYNYWRSSCSWRVRVALAAKNLSYEYIPVHLLKGEQQQLIHGMAQVPVLECQDSETGQILQISQSLAIIDFIEEAFPEGNSLLPTDTLQRTFSRELAEIINAGTQPFSNLSLVQKIDAMTSEEGKGRIFAEEAIEKGLHAMEAIVKNNRQKLLSYSPLVGPFLCGTFSPTIADACAIPQMYGARRFGLDLNSICPTLVEVERSCLNHPWFQVSHPEKQKDAMV